MFDTLFLCRDISTQKEAPSFHSTFGAKPQMPAICFPTAPRKGTAKSRNTTPHCFHLLPWTQVPSYPCDTGRMLHRATPNKYKESMPPGGAAKRSFPHPFYPCAKQSSLKLYPTATLSLLSCMKKPLSLGKREQGSVISACTPEKNQYLSQTAWYGSFFERWKAHTRFNRCSPRQSKHISLLLLPSPARVQPLPSLWQWGAAMSFERWIWKKGW